MLAPLGLSQSATDDGERHGRAVSVRITPRGSVTSLAGGSGALPLDGERILAYDRARRRAALGGRRGEPDGDRIAVRREGHEGAAWLWDLWLAERLADDPG